MPGDDLDDRQARISGVAASPEVSAFALIYACIAAAVASNNRGTRTSSADCQRCPCRHTNYLGLCSLASSETSRPAPCTSLPAPSIVLQAISESDKSDMKTKSNFCHMAYPLFKVESSVLCR
jgi:hypothetical protein